MIVVGKSELAREMTLEDVMGLKKEIENLNLKPQDKECRFPLSVPAVNQLAAAGGSMV